MGHATGELHSLVKHRRKALRQLESGALRLLVCSDTLARGIDVSCLDGVISYDAPSHLKTYVHRVGRTARAGRAGTAVTLVEERQGKAFTKMLRDGGVQGVEMEEVGEVEEARLLYTKSLEKTKVDLEEEKLKKKADKVKVDANKKANNIMNAVNKKRKRKA